MIFYSDEFFLAVRMGNIIFTNSYLPYDDHSSRSMDRYAKACNTLKVLVEKILSISLDYMIIDDFNTDINNPSVRSDSLLDCLPSYNIIPKTHPYSYIHHSGSKSNIDHIICSPSITTSIEFIHAEEHDLDHLPMSLTLTLNLNPASFCKVPWFKVQLTMSEASFLGEGTRSKKPVL